MLCYLLLAGRLHGLGPPRLNFTVHTVQVRIGSGIDLGMVAIIAALVAALLEL